MYEVLGVPRDAGGDAIRRAYRKAARRAHPDKGGSDAAMSLVNRAYAVLGDDGRREHYDRSGEESVPDQVAAMLMELANLMITLVDKCPNIDREDLVAAAKKCILNSSQEHRNTQARFMGQAKKLERAAARLKRKKGEGADLIRSMLDARIAELKRSADNGDFALERNKRMLELLGQYEYEVTTLVVRAEMVPDGIAAFLAQNGVIR